jgi:hypothetical protein
MTDRILVAAQPPANDATATPWTAARERLAHPGRD